MTKYNLILVYDQYEENILFCYRSKNPYLGKYNLVGGKIEEYETSIESAYRELYEETGITSKDISLHALMDFIWHPIHMSMDVFVGTLNKEVSLIKEVHELVWINKNEDFFDTDKYAGEGNIGHIVKIYNQLKEQIKR